MFESLYAKTFAILGSQILITWLTTLVLIVVARGLYYAKKFEFTATESETGEIDIHIPWEDIATPSIFIFFLQFFIGLGLIYWGKDQDISISFIWFSIWSVLTGTLLGIYLLLRNENHGSKALGITVIITLIVGLIGTYPGVNLLPLGPFFFVALMFLFSGYTIRLILGLHQARKPAIFSALFFIGFLLYDFNRLATLNEAPDANNWKVAMDLSIQIYLDFINLILDILEIILEIFLWATNEE